jgi:multiple sugar transport system ATP-binding protein
MSVLELSAITKSFGPAIVLRNVSLRLEPGEFLSVVGPSGCGKSTLLRIIAGLESQDSGEVRIEGRSVDDLAPKQRDVAMVFQSYALYPHMTVAQNIALPLSMRDLTRRERLPFAASFSPSVRAKRQLIQEAVRRTADLVELGHVLDRKPGQLSGGQRQRVALARALVRKPRLFLMDEPLSNLDTKLRTQTRGEIAALQQRFGITTLYVTHDQVEAMTMATRIAVMIGGEVVQLGTPRDIYNAPVDLRVAEFFGTPRINVLPGVLSDGWLRLASDAVSIPLRSGPSLGPITVAVRPEHVVVTREQCPQSLTGWLRQIEFLGSDALAHIELVSGRATVVAKIAPEAMSGLAKGAAINVKLALDRIHLFDPAGRRVQSDIQPIQARGRDHVAAVRAVR